MGKFWTLRQSLSVFLIFLPALVFYALQNRSLTTSKLGVLQTPAHWIQETYDVFTGQLYSTVDTYLNLLDIKSENTAMLSELNHYKAQLQLFEEYKKENRRLSALLDFKQELGRQTLAARIISKDIFIDQKSILVDKGSKQGVERLQAVVSPDGVVGYVISVAAESSRVLLITDRSASIDATIQRTRARGIVSGVSRQSCLLKYIMRKEDVSEGDIIVTSGRQGYFPKGFIVGHVVEVGASPSGVSFSAKIQPSVPVDKLEEVLILFGSDISLADRGGNEALFYHFGALFPCLNGSWIIASLFSFPARSLSEFLDRCFLLFLLLSPLVIILLLNIMLTLALMELSSLPPAVLLLVSNAMTVLIKIVQNRIHFTNGQLFLLFFLLQFFSIWVFGYSPALLLGGTDPIPSPG